ncbi:MAG: translation elongation factor 4 [Candidatus Brocadiia bacterium]
MTDPRLIRNFSIIAHIDHGKSTLADRLLEMTSAVPRRDMREQYLDSMDLERERGITIKAKPVMIHYEHAGVVYTLHLIDCPGHVDFSYEVSRSLAACEGALLLIDATQGVQAQTVANVYMAMEHNLEIIPVINKLDLPTARPFEVADEVEKMIGIDCSGALFTSGKTGQGVRELLDAIVTRIPCPVNQPGAPTRALIFDAVFNDYRGVVIYLRLFDGGFKEGDRIRMLGVGAEYEITELGKFMPEMQRTGSLTGGEVGYLIAAIRSIRDVRIGDTITHRDGYESVELLPGYRPLQRMVYCGVFPANNNDFESLRKALDKLSLNDSAFSFEPISSTALGFGFLCGFLGLLHMDIVRERLEREFGLSLISTAPTVTYQIVKTDGSVVVINSPSQMPDPGSIAEILEPIVRVDLHVPQSAIGAVMKLCEERRAKYVTTNFISVNRVIISYEMPYSEIIYDFFDKLKSATHGYGTLDYHFKEFTASDLVKVDIRIANSIVDALSMICHRDEAYYRGRRLVQRLRKLIPRQMFQVTLQAAIGSRVIAREDISPVAKNVTAKCYGGDVTRKRKLLEKQKEGKKRMKSIGHVEVPQEAFMSVLSIEEDEDKG